MAKFFGSFFSAHFSSRRCGFALFKRTRRKVNLWRWSNPHQGLDWIQHETSCVRGLFDNSNKSASNIFLAIPIILSQTPPTWEVWGGLKIHSAPSSRSCSVDWSCHRIWFPCIIFVSVASFLYHGRADQVVTSFRSGYTKDLVNTLSDHLDKLIWRCWLIEDKWSGFEGADEHQQSTAF